jgi:hypothetical protein
MPPHRPKPTDRTSRSIACASIAAEPEKTFDDIAVLAIVALYYRRGAADELVEEATEPDELDAGDLCSDDRALPALLLAVLEVLGIRLDTFAQPDAACGVAGPSSGPEQGPAKSRLRPAPPSAPEARECWGFRRCSCLPRALFKGRLRGGLTARTGAPRGTRTHKRCL